MNRTLIIGHRGAPETALENTRASLKAALEAGSSILEVDVRLTRDGSFVLAHDADFSRLGGAKTPIRHCTREEISKIVLRDERGRESPPLFFDEALQAFPGAVFNIDLKDPGLGTVRKWVDFLRGSGSGHRCRTASFRAGTLKMFHRLYPEAAISVARLGVLSLLLSEFIGGPPGPKAWEGVIQVPERFGIMRIVTPRRIKRWHRCGWEIHVWTVDNEGDMRRLIDWGVDGIITNRPSLLKEILK